MKGPLIFLVSLVAVLGIGAGVLLPVWQEKQDLHERQQTAGPGTGARALEAEKALRAAFDPPADRWEESLRARLPAGLSLENGPGLEDGRAKFRLAWNDLPALLSELAAQPIPPISSLSATPLADPDQCSVEIAFILDPADPETR